ncbi:MAG: D-tyrosyl-tRNA(Tyr) deacylase [Ignavibacteria bacterium]|nr:D-tyrosyl-tRNA(Tyr) deacylase [Ignavibacteria bacterium]
MIALVQRTSECSVSVGSEIIDFMNQGLLVLLGIKQGDNEPEAEYLASKVVNLRVFCDENDKMNHSLLDSGFDIMIVSQFTLHAETRHGNRPSFTEAAEPIRAKELYQYFINEVINLIGHDKVHTGMFGAMMKVKLVNDGPVTITLKSKNEL